MNVQSYLRQVRALRRRIFPLPKPERWVPQGVMVTEEDGEYYYVDEESEAIDARCQKLGITPNIYIVDDDFNPDMDGCETA